jgi:hypothetical protein
VHRQLLPALLARTSLDLAVPLRFCTDYGIDGRSFSLTLFHHMVLTRFSGDEARAAAVDALLTCVPDATTAPDTRWRSRMATLTQAMQPRRMVQTMLSALPGINGYDYDRTCNESLFVRSRHSHQGPLSGLQFACEQVIQSRVAAATQADTARRYLSLLQALRAYRRRPAAFDLPPAPDAPPPAPAYWAHRLSAHYLHADPMGALTGELTPATVAALAPVAEAAGQDADSLYVGVAERMVLAGDGAAGFGALRDVLRAIRAPRRAAEAAARAAEAMPSGGARLQAFTLAVGLADRWMATAQACAL